MPSPVRLGNTSALTAAILWLLCSALVAVAPEQAMQATGPMIHTDLTGMSFELTLRGVFVGLLAWSASAWTAGAVFAVCSRLLSPAPASTS
ncbi:MAG: hypothetical protein ACI8S6_003770 [Myxococcota bacterium]|jgi:hypothetical protein